MKALVVDDSPNVVDVLSDILKINNIEVIGQGRNGKEAVELYQKFKPDIVFLDVIMPVYDGFYAFEEIRKINPFSIIIFVSADPMLESKMQEKGVIPSAVVHKPFDINKITNVISSLKLTLSYSHDKMQSNLVKLCLERTLFEMGPEILEIVKRKLQSDFQISFNECLTHPEDLKKILKQEHEHNYDILMNKMENSFAGFMSDKKITTFLSVLES